MRNESEATDPWAWLARRFAGLGGGDRWLPLLQQHAALVDEWSARINLTTVSGDPMVRRHFGESLELLGILRARDVATERVVDIGSGAGFPGIVLAVAAPASEVVLLEPRKKRAAFLELVVAELGLSNVRVRAERAEEAGRGDLRGWATLVTARAVAPLAVLAEYGAPLAATGGTHAYAKGSGAAAELAEAAEAFAKLRVAHEATVRLAADVSPKGAVVLLRQAALAAERFPRRPGVAARRPLSGSPAGDQ